MKGINKVILIGNVGSIDSHTTNAGDMIVNLSLATSESYTKKDGEKVDKTEWHNVTLFKKLAEITSQYVVKGARIYIEGKLQTQRYTDKEGVERFSTKIIANTMQMLSSKKDSEKGNHDKSVTNNYYSYPEASKDDYSKVSEEGFPDDSMPF